MSSVAASPIQAEPSVQASPPAPNRNLEIAKKIAAVALAAIAITAVVLTCAYVPALPALIVTLAVAGAIALIFAAACCRPALVVHAPAHRTFVPIDSPRVYIPAPPVYVAPTPIFVPAPVVRRPIFPIFRSEPHVRVGGGDVFRSVPPARTPAPVFRTGQPHVRVGARDVYSERSAPPVRTTSARVPVGRR